MEFLNKLLNRLDRHDYPFIDGLYYLFVLLFLALLFLFFS